MDSGILEGALNTLAGRFAALNWHYPRVRISDRNEPLLYWPGDPAEDIMICVLRGLNFTEVLHRHGFFFINYAYRGDYEALSGTADNLVTIRENECYIGQPYRGYALRTRSDSQSVVLGVLIQREMFFKEFLSTIAADNVLLHFFTDPERHKTAEGYMRLSFTDSHYVRELLEIMAVEYARGGESAQLSLKPLVSALLLQIARRHREQNAPGVEMGVAERLLAYIAIHPESASLKELGRVFALHPAYISTLLHRKTGQTFSALLTAQRLTRAKLLLKNSDMTAETIALMLGYAGKAAFYRAFRSHYGLTPGQWRSSNS